MANQANTLRELTSSELDNVGGGTLAGPAQPIVDGAAGALVDVANGVAAGGNSIIDGVGNALIPS